MADINTKLSDLIDPEVMADMVSARIPKKLRVAPFAKIDDTLCADTLGFVGCYLLLFIAGALALTLTARCGLTEAMFEFASALGTVGLSIGLTGPATGSATLIVEMIGMIMGRLEIFIVLTGIYFGLNRVKFIWREHKKARQQRRSEKSSKAK